jgi:hypothetical protein
MPLSETASLPQPSSVEEWWSAHSNFSTRWETETFFSHTDALAPAEPTNAPLAMATSGPGINGLTSSGNATAPLPEETSSPRGNRIGMAVGLGVGVPLLLAVVGFLTYFLRRCHNREDAGGQSWPGSNSGDGTTENEKTKRSTSKAYGFPTKAELPAEEIPAQIQEMEGSSAADHKSSVASPLLLQDSKKGDVREYRIDNTPVFELPG